MQHMFWLGYLSLNKKKKMYDKSEAQMEKYG